MTDRARRWRWAALALGAVLVFMAAFVPIPFVTRSPGPVFDVLGDSDGKPVIEITGAKQYPTTGTLYMTTVAESGGGSGAMTVGSAILGLVSPTTSVLPDPLAGQEQDDTAYQEAVFDASGSNAVGAAAGYLDRPVHTQPVIIAVVPGSASENVFHAGDLVDRVNGKTVTNRRQLGRVIRSQPVGTEFRMIVVRDGKKVEETVASRPAPDDPSRPVLGILLDNHYTSDFDAEITLTQIGGPSAGLMLSVAMVDKLTPGELLAGHDVAGTGTISGTGTVGEIGGIDKKMIAAKDAGATLFIAPRGNCDEVVTSTPDGLQVAPVSTLRQTIDVITRWRDRKPVPVCPADSAQDGNG